MTPRFKRLRLNAIEASSAFKEGGLADGLAKAKSVKEKAVEIMTNLGMQVPEAAKS